MDPALLEFLRRSSGDAILEAAALLRHGASVPQEMRVVARFGDVVTCRIRAEAVRSVRAHRSVVSLKAARTVEPTHAVGVMAGRGATQSRGVSGASGRGVLVASLDWGCDFAHPAFRRSDGATRLMGLWEPRGGELAAPTAPHGYG